MPSCTPTGCRTGPGTPNRDFTLDAAHGSPVGIWSDGTTMWASDFADGKLYAYRMSDRSRDSGKDFDTLSAVGNDLSRGHLVGRDHHVGGGHRP